MSAPRPVDLATIPDDDDVAEVVRLPMVPQTRADCIDGPRPCPWGRCAHHMAHGMPRSWWTQTDDEIAEALLALPETCVLDVADGGPRTLLEVGELVGGLSRERVRQILNAAFVRARIALNRRDVDVDDFEHPDEWGDDHGVAL